MRTPVSASPQSRFAPIAELARSVIDAPAGPDGAPRVYVAVEHQGGHPALVVKTADDNHAVLELAEDDPQRLDAALAYLTGRLSAIGMVVVSDEAQLAPLH